MGYLSPVVLGFECEVRVRTGMKKVEECVCKNDGGLNKSNCMAVQRGGCSMMLARKLK
jgi:hypothetical protein